MLQIRLNKGGSSGDGGGGVTAMSRTSNPSETVMVACPDHLILADLPVAKSLGMPPSSNALSVVAKSLGRRSRRNLGERVHFCVACDFPISIYGRLLPCEHVFCLTCARSDSSCYLCDGRIQKIQTIKLMEEIFICAAPHCLKSFLKRSDFESHVHEVHADLLQQEMYPDGANETYPMNMTKTAQPDSSNARGPSRLGFLPNLNSQIQDHEDGTRRHHSRESTPMRPPIQQMQPPFHVYQQHQSAESQADNNNQQTQVWFQNPQALDHQSGLQNKHMGIPPESPFSDHNTPTHTFQLPNYPMQQMHVPLSVPMAMNNNPGLNPSPQFNYPPQQQPMDGSHLYYNSTPEGGNHQDQSSLLGFPPPILQVGAGGFPGNTRQWNAVGFGSTQFESVSVIQGNPNIVDNQGMSEELPH